MSVSFWPFFRSLFRFLLPRPEKWSPAVTFLRPCRTGPPHPTYTLRRTLETPEKAFHLFDMFCSRNCEVQDDGNWCTYSGAPNNEGLGWRSLPSICMLRYNFVIKGRLPYWSHFTDS
jgi:hypothetical protein